MTLKKKDAYGFPTHEWNGYGSCVHGEVYAEDGKFLGSWVSSDLSWLASDLATHAAKDYNFHFSLKPPEFLTTALLKEKHGKI